MHVSEPKLPAEQDDLLGVVQSRKRRSLTAGKMQATWITRHRRQWFGFAQRGILFERGRDAKAVLGVAQGPGNGPYQNIEAGRLLENMAYLKYVVIIVVTWGYTCLL